MKTITVRWLVTEEHQADIEVEDDFDIDNDLDDELIAEHEDARSWMATPERDVLEVRDPTKP